MKNIKGVLIAVFVVVILVVVGAVSYEAMIGAPKAAEQQNILKQYNFPGNANGGKAPSSGFSNSGGTQPGTAVSSGDADVNSMIQELDATKDDGGASDVQSLQNDVSGL